MNLPVTIRRLGQVVCVVSVALITFADADLWPADAVEPVATSAPAGSETIEVPDAPSEPTSAQPDDVNPALGRYANTAEIPQGSPAESPSGADSGSGDALLNYQRAQEANPYTSGIGSADDFIEGEDRSPLGLTLRPDNRRLESGEVAAGLLVVSVAPGGPADKAGVKPYRHAARSTLEAVSVAGAFFFPPAMLLLPVLESTRIGDSYDMITGIDGYRVTGALDFEDCMRDVQSGEIVYLSVVRNGSRLQVPVSVPLIGQ
jgi:hypothetical protein